MRFKHKSVYFLLLAIIIPSAILAFFSLSTLKSQKSLMDKELSRRSYAISAGISEQVGKVFKETESQIESTILSSIKSKSAYDEITKKSKRLPVRQILLIGPDYNLKYPDIPWIDESETPKIKLSTEFTSKFTGVEKKEISGKFEEAISGYKKLKSNTSNVREKAIRRIEGY